MITFCLWVSVLQIYLPSVPTQACFKHAARCYGFLLFRSFRLRSCILGLSLATVSGSGGPSGGATYLSNRTQCARNGRNPRRIGVEESSPRFTDSTLSGLDTTLV
jgi:hypothetical protein